MRYPIPANTDTSQLQTVLPIGLRRPDAYIFVRAIGEPPTEIEYVVELTPAELTVLEDIFMACQAKESYKGLPEWARDGTAAQAETYINNQIFNGMTQVQVDAWLDANVTGTTVTALRTSTIKALKLVGDALVAERELFKITAKLLIYIRDLVIRFQGR